MIKVLVIDDELDMLLGVEKLLTASGIKSFSSSNGTKALLVAEHENIDVILCDLFMPEMDGLQLIKNMKLLKPNVPIIIFSAFGTVERAVEAMKIGAYNFIEKPFNTEYLLLLIKRAYEQKKVIEENNNLLINWDSEFNFQNIISRSSKMKKVFELISRVAPTDENVLITGESGTGKELVARAIHNLSKRKTEPFVPINCSALPENLFESELFGYEKNAFTGAEKQKTGLLEYTDKGSFFLDEVFEMPLSIQVKMLRVLQDKKFRRIGGKKLIETDVRFISASNKKIDEALSDKKLREDFYYRLNVINIELPPLRDRKDDILLLANYFLKKSLKNSQRDLMRFDEKAAEILRSYNWPGNVRELQNIISHIIVTCDSDIIKISNLPKKIQKQNTLFNFDLISLAEAKKVAIEKLEMDYLLFLLKKYSGNVSKMAECSGFTRRHLYRILNKYHLNSQTWRKQL